jgi:Icc-related predicted phosphoesterase
MIKILATSDIHGVLPEVEPCDLLLLGGDLCPEGSNSEQAAWLDGPFRQWLKRQPAKEIVGIAGNHDLVFEEAPDLVPKDLPWHYLQDESIQLFGKTIYGTPWQLRFIGVFNGDEEELEKIYRKIPANLDILLSHGPPFGFGDELQFYIDQKPDPSRPLTNVGAKSLLDTIYKIRPKLSVVGHIHRSFGIYLVDDLVIANVSLLSDLLERVNKPVVFYM